MSQQPIKDLARSYARETLARSPSFFALGKDDQLALYRDIYRHHYNDLARGNGQSTAPRSEALFTPLTRRASDMIDDERHLNQRIDDAGRLAGEFIDEVDFPGFVRDLLKGVFDANLEVTITQMEAYQKLLKAATRDISYYIRSIDNTAAFGYLAENNGDEFGLSFSDLDRDAEGQPQAVLTDAEGNPLDIGDNEVKSRIMNAKIAMAQEHRAMLRESILMGITRLVVERGVVKASVLFDVKATEQIAKDDRAALRDQVSSSSSIAASGGILGSILGGPSGGTTRSRRRSRISVSSAKSVANTELAARVAGSVDITFKSDYFQLDNFARMYGPVSQEDRQQAAAGIAGSQQPAAAR